MSTETEGQVSNRSVSYDIDLSQGNSGDPFTSAVVTQAPPAPVFEPLPGAPEPIPSGEVDHTPPEPQEPTITEPVGAADSEINPYYYLGEALKADGYLPDTIEINEKVAGTTLYNGFKEKLKGDLETQIRQEVYQSLEAEGVTSNDLLMARALRSGVDPRLLSTGSMFETYASMPDTVSDDQKLNVVTQMYQHRQFKGDEIKRLIASAEADDNVAALFTEGKDYFAERFNEFAQAENLRYANLRKANDERASRVNSVIRQIMTTGEIFDEKLSKDQLKEFEDAIRKEDQTIEVEGNKYRGSEMQKFLVDFDQNPEMKFLLFKLYKFRGQEKDKVKLEAVQEVQNDFLKAYETKVLSSKKVSQQQEVKSQLETQKASTKSYFVDLSHK